MKTLVIPDIHENYEWVEPLISKINPSRVIFLGDYFDRFYDSPYDTRKLINWMQTMMSKYDDNFMTFLMGNHDASYRWYHMRCSGWTPDKYAAYASLWRPNDWDRFKLYTTEQGFMLSHAGIQPSIYLGCDKLAKGDFNEFDDVCFNAIRSANSGNWPLLLDIGKARYPASTLNVGGIIWCDFNDEFKPVDGLNQIVGHTKQYTIIKNPEDGTEKINWEPTIKNGKNSINIGLDTDQHHVLVLENGNFDFIRIEEN